MLTGITLYRSKEITFKKPKVIVVIASIVMLHVGYVYGTLICLNYLLDKTPAKEYSSRVLSKRMDSGKTTTCYFSIAPWGNRKDTMEVTVSEGLYESSKEGQPLVVYYQIGAFGIPTIDVGER